MSKGRGPTSDMSPLSTFQSWGSSSRLNLRMNCPIRVRRSTSGRGWASGPSASRIVRNLARRNGRPRYPGRIWRKSTGAPRANQMARATDANNGDRTSRPRAAQPRSQTRFRARVMWTAPALARRGAASAPSGARASSTPRIRPPRWLPGGSRAVPVRVRPRHAGISDWGH